MKARVGDIWKAKPAHRGDYADHIFIFAIDHDGRTIGMWLPVNDEDEEQEWVVDRIYDLTNAYIWMENVLDAS